MLVAALASLLLATSAVAQEASAAPSPSVMPISANGTAAPANETETTAWNKTSFAFPNRGEQGYWVANTTNHMYWTPVIEPTYLRLSNTNFSLWAETMDVSEQINGGIGNHTFMVPDMPVGNHYVLTLCEIGTNKKLAQSNGFRIKPVGSVLAAYTPSEPSVSKEMETTNSTSNANSTAPMPSSNATTPSATPSPTGGAERAGAGVLVTVLAFGAVLAVV